MVCRCAAGEILEKGRLCTIRAAVLLLISLQQLLQIALAFFILFLVVLGTFHVLSLIAVRCLGAEALERFLAERGWLQRCAYYASIVTWALWWQKVW